MQKIILFFIIVLNSWSATIDTSFYQGENIPLYYQQVEKDINGSIHHKLKNKKIITLEQSTLQKLKEFYTHKDDFPTIKTIHFPQQKIPEQVYLSALWKIGDLSNKLQQLQTKKKEFQENLFDLKNKIEKETPTSKGKTLLIDQMQYAFYKLSLNKIIKTHQLYQELFDKEYSKFKTALKRVTFTKEKHSQNIIKKIEQKIDTLQKKDLLLTIDKDSVPINTDKHQKQIQKHEKQIQQETDESITKKLNTHFLLALKALQQKNEKIFLKTIEKIDQDIKQLSPNNRKKILPISKLLLDFGEEKSDTTSTAIASTQIGFQNILDTLDDFTNKTLFVYEEKAFSIQTILTFSFILFIGFVIAKIYKNFVDKFRRTNRIKSLSVARMIANSGYYLIILGTFFIALRTIGLDMHTIFIVIGAILLWLAFGLQSFISNYAIGILFKIDRSIRIGDHIELDSHTVGDVDDMNFRSITIRSSDNIRTTIPNSRLISDTFINHTLEGESRRLHVHFSANKHIPYTKIEQQILNALKQSNLKYFKQHDKQPHIIIVDINRKITRYALIVWVAKESTYDMSLIQSEFLKLIHQVLYPPKEP